MDYDDLIDLHLEVPNRGFDSLSFPAPFLALFVPFLRMCMLSLKCLFVGYIIYAVRSMRRLSPSIFGVVNCHFSTAVEPSSRHGKSIVSCRVLF